MGRIFQHILPRSLAGQLMAAVLITLLVAQAINLGLLIAGQKRERANVIAASAATMLSSARDRLRENPDAFAAGAGRAQRVRIDPARASGGQAPIEFRAGFRRLTIADAPQFHPQMRDWPEMRSRVAGLLSEYGWVTQVRAAHMAAPARNGARAGGDARRTRRWNHALPEVVAVAARLDDGRWVTARARVPTGGEHVLLLLIGQTIIVFLLLLGPILFVAWRATRPLKHLARAAATLRPDVAEGPLVESGPSDVRELTRAFNAMRARIASMIREKDHMLGAVGHDLRTPLASLRVRVEGVEDARLRGAMTRSIDDLGLMLEDILALARAGQPRETPEDVAIGPMLDQLVGDYAMLARPVSRGADMGDAGTAMLRPRSIARALRNLVDNGIAYGGGVIIAAERTRGAIHLVVRDHGPGIAPDKLAQMVEPFTRAETSRNRDTGGSGLGLALARAAAQADGGRLELENGAEGGLIARIILPIQA